MATKTWYCTSSLVSVHQEMSETDPGAEAYASPTTGWIVSTGATNRSPLNSQVEQAAATFVDTTPPDGSIDTSTGDCLRTTNTYSGSFASGNWTVHLCVRAQTNGGSHDGNMLCRLFRSANADGSSATEITAAAQTGSTVTNLATSATQDSSVTFNPGAFTVTNEYIFVQVAWARSGAGGMSTDDVNLRVGNGSSNGTRVVSADFTQAVAIGEDGDFYPPTVRTAAQVALAGALALVADSMAARAGEVYRRDGEAGIPAGALSGQPDEDYWQNPSAPRTAAQWLRLPLGDPEELPAGSLKGQPDEDYWQNPTAPRVASQYVQLPIGDPEEIPATALYGLPEEMYWQNPAAPQQAAQWQPLPIGDRDSEVPVLFGVLDESIWIPHVFAVPTAALPTAISTILALIEAPITEEVSADPLPGDDDPYAARAPQTQVSWTWTQSWRDEDTELEFRSEEDWGLFRWPQWGRDWRAPVFGPTANEDFWVAPPPPPMDHDMEWRNPVRPVVARMHVRLPLGDPEQYPAPGLVDVPRSVARRY